MAEAEKHLQNVDEVESEEELDIIDTVSDIVSIGIGSCAGVVVGAVMNNAVPVARNLTESVIRWTGIAGIGIGAQQITSEAISNDIDDIRRLLHSRNRRRSKAKRK